MLAQMVLNWKEYEKVVKQDLIAYKIFENVLYIKY